MPSPLLKEIQEKRSLLDQKRGAFLDELEKLSAEDLTSKPSPDRWSLLQVAQHLVLGERDVLQQLPDLTELAKRKRGMKDRLMSGMVE